MPSKKKLELKKKQVTELAEELKDAEAIIFADYKGLTVEQDTAMRADFRSKGLNYRVVKNSITERAFEKLGIEGLDDIFEGPTAIAYSHEEVVLAPRLIREYSEKFKKISMKGGVINGEVQNLDYLTALSHVASKETLYGQLLFMLLYPLTAFAQVAAQIVEKGEEMGAEKVADVVMEKTEESTAVAEQAPKTDEQEDSSEQKDEQKVEE